MRYTKALILSFSPTIFDSITEVFHGALCELKNMNRSKVKKTLAIRNMGMNTRIVLALKIIINVQFTGLVIQNKKPLRYSVKALKKMFFSKFSCGRFKYFMSPIICNQCSHLRMTLDMLFFFVDFPFSFRNSHISIARTPGSKTFLTRIISMLQKMWCRFLRGFHSLIHSPTLYLSSEKTKWH